MWPLEWRVRAGGAHHSGMKKIHEQIDQHTDARGTVFEPLSPAELVRQRNSHVVLSGPGRVRGNHYHTRGTEILAVRGPALVRYREEMEVTDVDVPPREVVVFRFAAGVPHAVRNTGTAENLIVAFRDVEHDPTGSDTIPEILIPPGESPAEVL